MIRKKLRLLARQKGRQRKTRKFFWEQLEERCMLAAIDFDGGGFTFNQSGASVDFRAETNTLANAFFIDGSADKIGFGTSTPADASVEINQANSSGAIACLSLDQDDTDQEFIKFDGTSASDQSSSITTDTSVGSLTGHIRVNVNGTDFWIPYYATN